MKSESSLLVAICILMMGCKTGTTANRSVVSAQSTESSQEQTDLAGIIGDWRFVWKPHGTGFPIESSLVLHAEHHEQDFPIKEPRDMQQLKGLRIQSPQEALRFVRLFTKGMSYYRFIEPRAIELDDSWATIELAGPAYRISRQLLFLREHPGLSLDASHQEASPLYEVRETLHPDGKYSCERVRLVRWVKMDELEIVYIQ